MDDKLSLSEVYSFEKHSFFILRRHKPMTNKVAEFTNGQDREKKHEKKKNENQKIKKKP